jgi:hypothetical protein
MTEDALRGVDESLAVRVAALSPGGQRWLKTAIQAIRNIDPAPPRASRSDDTRETRAGFLPAAPEKADRPAANLEDVITGKADLRDQMASYPELGQELDGLADIIDLLREAGKRRRKKGEDILREEILGEGRDRRKKKPADEEEDGEEA